MNPRPEAPLLRRLAPLLAARALLAVALVIVVAPVSVDDYFRIFHARWWWDHVGFTGSYEWTPGHSYLYGLAVGLTGDMVTAPRILTALLHLAAVVALALAGRGTDGARVLGAAIALFCPLALVLGTVPLTESLFVFLVACGAAGLGRYCRTGDARAGLAAAAFCLAAAAVRYEGFLAAGLFFALALPRRPSNASRWAGVAIAAVPWIFPAVWIALLWGVKGDPLAFLRVVRDDHFGPGRILPALASAEGLVTAALALFATGASAVRAAAALRRRAPGECVLELHALLFAGVAIAVVATGNVPSQYPLRLLYPPIAFGAMPLAAAVAPALPARGRALALAALGAAAAFGAAGYAAVSRPSEIPQEDLAAAAAIRGAFERGELGPDDHVLIEHELPSAAGLFVLSNRAERVHIDSLGDLCAPKMLTDHESVCPLPEWAPRVRLAVLRAGEPEELWAGRSGWRLVRTVGRWRFRARPDGAR